MRKKCLCLCFAAIITIFCGCSAVHPEIVGTPTPSASPTPEPEPYLAEVTGAPLPTDQLGSAIESENHYFQYLAFGDLRVYEYEDGTFLDGVCVNGYPKTLDGGVDIVYYTEAGEICGIGTLYNASGETTFVPGSNSIYAQIQTDIDVRMMDFRFSITTPFQPIDDDTKS